MAFYSDAWNLVAGDTNGTWDVFVHDRQTRETTRLSVSSFGEQGNNASWWPAISGDGRFVTFHSDASNLVFGDFNYAADVFVHDRQIGQTTRVSVSSIGEEADDSSYSRSISADGRFVAFESYASNLIPQDTNGQSDVFVHDRHTLATTRVSVSSSGVQGNVGSYYPSISADGRFVAFESYASNLITGDTNGEFDVFVHDRQTGGTTRVSVSSSGAQGANQSYYPSISADGRVVAFTSWASNLVSGDTNGFPDVFVHDRQTGQTTRVSLSSSGAQGSNWSYYPSISADARFVAFTSLASNLGPGDTNGESDVFVHNLKTSQTTRVSVSSFGAQGNGPSALPSISANGSLVAFYSRASNLVSGDTNYAHDVFVHAPLRLMFKR